MTKMGLAESALAAKPKAEKKPGKKAIREVRHRAAKSGGYVVEHHHHDPSHEMEEHTMPDQAALMAHMQANPPMAAGEPDGDEAQA